MKRAERFNSICRRYKVQLAFLYGSLAEAGHRYLLGKENASDSDPHSDLDLGVVFMWGGALSNVREKLRLYGHLSDDLSALFSPFQLDLVFLEETDYLVQYEAIKGINVFKRSNITLADYKERVLKYAVDWKFEMDRFHEEVRKAIREGQIVVSYTRVSHRGEELE